MHFPQALKNSFFTILFTFFLTVQITACSTEGNYSAEQEVTTSTTELGTGINKNSPAEIRGVDSGSVTEDIDPDKDNLLEVGGKLTVIDSDTSESAFIAMTSSGDYGSLTIDSAGDWHYSVENNLPVIQNLTTGSSLIDRLPISSVDGTNHPIIITILGVNEANQPAFISGTDTRSVTEDTNSNYLTTGGILNIIDNDNGEDVFFTQSKKTNFGSFILYGSGYWIYSANNNLAAIQNLDNGQTLTDNISINSVDGTSHTITITINGVDEPNIPAIISGDDSGTVIEDIDPDNDGLLEINGKLTITDADSGEAVFKTAGISGNYGNLFIDTSGNWSYAAINNQNIIQSLGNSENLIDTFTVSSADNTTHTIYITINGVNDTNTTGDITLSWTTPTEREDNTPLTLFEIAGYKIYYGTTPAQYNDSITINNSQTTSYLFEDFATGTYYFVITTLDTNGRESQQSSEVQKTN